MHSKLIKSVLTFTLLMATTLCGCGHKTVGGGGRAGAFTPGRTYIPALNEAAAKTVGGCTLDLSGAGTGTIICQNTSATQMVCQVTKGKKTYNYWFDDAHQTLTMPLSEGSGTYRITIMQNTGGSRFVAVGEETVRVRFKDDKTPFVSANSVVNFSEGSTCVTAAANLAARAKSDLDFTSKVVDYVESHLRYDQAFADSNPKFYFPDPDSTLATGKGICFDYAALTAAMLRSQGVPAKVYVGYVTVGGKAVYHAWNMVYIKNKGWITVKMSADGHHWNRVDTTMDDTGDLSEIDADSYQKQYIY